MTTYLLAPHLFPAFQKLYVGTIVAFQFYSTAAKFKHIMGKVHGSLARAGKVKGQTPKVEKQEKKKVVRGRANIFFRSPTVCARTVPQSTGGMMSADELHRSVMAEKESCHFAKL